MKRRLFCFGSMAWLTDAGWPWDQAELDKQQYLELMIKALFATRPHPINFVGPNEESIFRMRN